MAQEQNKTQRFTMMALFALGYFLLLQFVMPKFFPPPTPAGAGTVLQQAQQLDADGRKADPNVALTDRIKKLEQAANKYEEVYNTNKGKPEGWDARFRQINVYDYLAALEGAKAGTHWYDLSETKLKDMEKSLHGKSAEVTLEDNRMENNQVVTSTKTESGDLSALATQKLNEIRADKDAVHRKNWTWQILNFFVVLAGGKNNPGFSYFLALALIVITLKTITYPFQKKQFQYQRDMQRVAPLLKEVQEKYKDRPQEEISRRVMEVYKENNVNLAAGCLPMLVMMFALLPMFWMVRDYEYQFVNGHFLWIGSEISKHYWFLADNLAQFDVPLFALYLISTIGYSLLQPKPADPQQAQQQKMMMFSMPLIFGIFMWQGQWSSAFMLYWLVLNIVSMIQSWMLLRHFGPPDSAAPAIVTGGTPAAPATPLTPMKGVHTDKPKKEPRGRGATPRIRPRGAK
jgi:YidC/Oxa1 family membrane protein insertase